ncbi:MAG: hypothetical protein RBR86_06085 [Pseudobdellovibrionaceae bacterium]|jgi:hypothetical protein|nr:hypothetical protein [Pseudobdellovibrionaceae bacterium]
MTETYLDAKIEDQTSVEESLQEGVPAKFWDAEKKEIKVEALMKSYKELEKKLSCMMPIPESDADKVRLHKMLGCPDTPEGYEVTLSNEFLDVDPELNARLHGKGFTSAQVQEVYDLAGEKLVPLILEMAAEFQAEREIERLVEAFGGVAKWQEISRQLQEYGRKILPAPAFEGMACSYDGVMALYRMMQKDGKIPSARADGEAGDVSDEKSLRKMMQDPRYWRDRNPAFIAQVSAGFEKLYGGK